jgi:hypothetical protein
MLFDTAYSSSSGGRWVAQQKARRSICPSRLWAQVTHRRKIAVVSMVMAVQVG